MLGETWAPEKLSQKTGRHPRVVLTVAGVHWPGWGVGRGGACDELRIGPRGPGGTRRGNGAVRGDRCGAEYPSKILKLFALFPSALALARSPRDSCNCLARVPVSVSLFSKRPPQRT